MLECAGWSREITGSVYLHLGWSWGGGGGVFGFGRTFMTLLEVPDLDHANKFISGSIDRFSQCFVSFELLKTTSDFSTPVTVAIASTAASAPAQLMSGAAFLVGVALLVFGYKLLRPVNFFAGTYLGGTFALLMLNIFAPAFASCPIIVVATSASGLLLGVLCALKRTSVLVVLGLVVGEIIGDLFYKTMLARLAPEYVAFGCIGFFSVLTGVLAGNAGDFAWKVGCSFFGAYLVVANFLRLAVVPYAPDSVKFEGFLAFRPDVTQTIARASQYKDTILGSPYVYGPVVVLLLLTVAGAELQSRLSKAELRAKGEPML